MICWLFYVFKINGDIERRRQGEYRAFFHHYQGNIDFNTVNIHRTVGMYFLVSTGNRGDIE